MQLLTISDPQDNASLWLSICIKQWGNQQSPHSFLRSSSLPQAKFEKAIKVKWAERMELCIANEGWYFEKAQTKNTDCKMEESEE